MDYPPVVAPRHPAFGEHVRAIGEAFEGLRDDLFGVPEPVQGRRVDPVHATLDGPPDRRDRLRVVLRPERERPTAPAGRPRPEPDPGYLYIAVPEPSPFHCVHAPSDLCTFMLRLSIGMIPRH